MIVGRKTFRPTINPVRREKSWKNVTKGVESRFSPEVIKRFDKLLSDIEAAVGTIAGAGAEVMPRALEKWFNANYLPLMKEKGLEVRDKVKRSCRANSVTATLAMTVRSSISAAWPNTVVGFLTRKSAAAAKRNASKSWRISA